MAQENPLDRLLLDKPLPVHSEAERMVLGCIMLDNELMAEAATVLSREAFGVPSNGAIFDAMVTLAASGEAINPLTLVTELQRLGELDRIGGHAAIARLIDGVPRFSNIDSYLRLVANAHMSRRLVRIGSDVAVRAVDGEDPVAEQIEYAQRQILDLEAPGEQQSWSGAGELSQTRLADLENFCASGRYLRGLATGLTGIDGLLGGLQKSDLIIIGARPSMGKSGLLLAMADGAASSRLNEESVVAIFEVEMSKDQLADRWLSMRSGVDGHRMNTGQVNQRDWQALTRAQAEIAAQRVYIDDRSNLTTIQMRSRLRQLNRRYKQGVSVVFVDYLQRMRAVGRAESRLHEVRQIVADLKSIAKDFNVPVVALSSLSRKPEERTDKRPILSDLRETGDIESDADVVMFIYRDEVYNPHTDKPGIAEISIQKNRKGPLGVVELRWIDVLTKFENL